MNRNPIHVEDDDCDDEDNDYAIFYSSSIHLFTIY